MSMKPDRLVSAVEWIHSLPDALPGLTTYEPPPEALSEPIPPLPQPPQTPVILMSPQGRVFNHAVAEELAQHPRLILVCGHYEGFDERVREHLATDEISIGDYVLT